MQSVVESCVLPEMFQAQYDNVWQKNPKWNAIEVTGGELYEWDESSTYIQEPPFLVDLKPEVEPIKPIIGGPLSGGARRFGDDRPHFAGGFDRGQQPGG